MRWPMRSPQGGRAGCLGRRTSILRAPSGSRFRMRGGRCSGQHPTDGGSCAPRALSLGTNRCVTWRNTRNELERSESSRSNRSATVSCNDPESVLEPTSGAAIDLDAPTKPLLGSAGGSVGRVTVWFAEDQDVDVAAGRMPVSLASLAAHEPHMKAQSILWTSANAEGMSGGANAFGATSARPPRSGLEVSAGRAGCGRHCGSRGAGPLGPLDLTVNRGGGMPVRSARSVRLTSVRLAEEQRRRLRLRSQPQDREERRQR